MTVYNDQYPTCADTYATLRVFTGVILPDQFTNRLGVAPTCTQKARERPPGIKNIPAGWFLTSRGAIDSRDVRRHLDWLLAQIENGGDAFNWIRDSGGETDVSCYWLSVSGQGGPSLWPTQMSLLGSLGLQISFDVCFGIRKL